ncbi:EamA family transporter RarD [Halobacillus sp. Marseille-P3879]|uniref:EamA family transporter RarD n=1 Tax=Halobacillus TaxID=45667 RepID=UPI000C79577D|nr:EamA family transporter RarD [Halobacillus sp. Marseille-P3879]
MEEEQRLGIIYTSGAYVLWGFLPIYWKLMQHIPPFEILAHRIIWSAVFMTIVILFLRKRREFVVEAKQVWQKKRSLIGITLASLMISLNWLTYIWGVNNNHVVEASLGYYINPLVSIMLGMIVLKETFTRPQWIAFLLAASGVIYMTVHFGSVPWIALLLAFSFGMYGLLKKLVPLNAMFGLMIETLIVSPLALIYLTGITRSYEQVNWISWNTVLVFGAGIATAIPLLLFAAGAKRIPLSLVGFLQYFAPTIMLILGVFLYEEPFTDVHAVSFILIWSGLAVYTFSRFKRLRKYEAPGN